MDIRERAQMTQLAVLTVNRQSLSVAHAVRMGMGGSDKQWKAFVGAMTRQTMPKQSEKDEDVGGLWSILKVTKKG